MSTQKIIITVSGGVVQCVSGIPLGIEVEVRDYDTDGTPDEHCKEDEKGDIYQEILFAN